MTKEIKMVEEMLSLQDNVNSTVDKDWKLKNREWYRAGWVECGELMGSLPYKWWKHQEPDLKNARIELVDIWHFILSKCIETNVCADIITEHWRPFTSNSNELELIDLLAFNLLKMRYEGGSIIPVIEYFSIICDSINISLEDVYLFYIGKATLNNFRQNNGYKEGTYVKMWKLPQYNSAGEDNYFLTSILENFKGAVPDNLSEQIYDKLKYYYNRIDK